MPGINQLKQFDNDILPIGDEPEIRRKNGTTMPEFAVPENLPEGDDSLDFEFGLPQREEEAGENASGDEGASDAARDKTESDAGEIREESATLPEQPPIPSMEDLDPDIAAFLAGTAPSPAPSSRQKSGEPESSAVAADAGGEEVLPAADTALSSGFDLDDLGDLDNLDDLDMDSSFLSSSAPASKPQDTDFAPADLTAQTESPAESAKPADLTPQDKSSF